MAPRREELKAGQTRPGRPNGLKSPGFYQGKQTVAPLETGAYLTDIRAVPEPWGLMGHDNAMEWLDGRVE